MILFFTNNVYIFTNGQGKRDISHKKNRSEMRKITFRHHF